MYKIKIEQFEGPLDVLLGLIEKQELDITKVSLSQITEDYLKILEQSILKPEELADFLVVASKLLFIKSQSLFPQIDLEEEGVSIEDQLKLLKLYHDASKNINNLIQQKKFAYFRTKMPVTRVFRPPQKTTIQSLKEAMEGVIKKLAPIIRIPKKINIKAVSIGETIQHIKDQILSKVRMSFRHLLGESKDKIDVIVNFLALLELCKQRVVYARQEGLFNDIMVEKKEIGEKLNLR